jgi:hypothetical protein
MNGCRHAPFLEQPERTLAIIADYVSRLDRIEAADVKAA